MRIEGCKRRFRAQETLYSSLMSHERIAIRRQFPILTRLIDGSPLAYLDNAATTQKPQVVLDRLRRFYEEENANINRGMHPLAEAATVAYERARKTVANFIGAKRSHEIIFTRGATESINLVARSFGDTLKKGDRIALTLLEHHGNIVPWLQLKERKNIEIDWIGLTPDGRLDLQSLDLILAKGKTKLIAVTGLSNVLGVAPPMKHIIEKARTHGALVLIDAAQLVAHATIDVAELDADFLVFSGHKIYGPTGIGVLYGKESLLEKMPPFLGGGDMIASVIQEGFTCAELPRKFEAGTPAIADAIGLATAIEWMEETGTNQMHAHTKQLTQYAQETLRGVKGVTMLGPRESDDLLGCVSFVVEDVHPHDLTEVLGRKGICLRSGHHCTQPLHKHFAIPASTRLSVAAYNTTEEIDRCIDEIKKARALFKK